jgi:hypothetical protein
MFYGIKPGHVLRFGTCPKSVISPIATNAEQNDNTLETPWPTTSNLGLVQCLSHPSGNIGAIATHVATHLRAGPDSKARSASYSPVGRFLTASNRPVGQETCDFVGYVDGRSNYIQSAETVFSKDFSGCLLVAYTVGGHRRVAHVAASDHPRMDCKQAFMNTLQAMHADLIGWFKPYVDAYDFGRKTTAHGVVHQYIGNNINKLVTFGVMTKGGAGFSIDAFKPDGIAGSDWVVTYITEKTLSHTWHVH